MEHNEIQVGQIYCLRLHGQKEPVKILSVPRQEDVEEIGSYDGNRPFPKVLTWVVEVEFQTTRVKEMRVRVDELSPIAEPGE